MHLSIIRRSCSGKPPRTKRKHKENDEGDSEKQHHNALVSEPNRRSRHFAIVAPQRSIDTFIRYPSLYQSKMNAADSIAFANEFRGVCEEGFVAVGYYIDDKGNPIRKEALRCMIGWVQYKRYLDDLFRYMPDAVFTAWDTTFTRTASEIIVTAGFTYEGTCLTFKPKTLHANELQDLSDLRKVPTCADLTATESAIVIDSTRSMDDCEGTIHDEDVAIVEHTANDDVDKYDADGIAQFVDVRDEKQFEPDFDIFKELSLVFPEDVDHNDPVPTRYTSTETRSASVASSSSNSSSSVTTASDLSYRWIPAEASSSPSQSALPSTQAKNTKQQYVVGQFLPSKPKALVAPENSALADGQAVEVRLRGKCRFYINSASMLIRRVEFSYHELQSENES